MKSSEFECVKRAHAIVREQMKFYNEMMQEKEMSITMDDTPKVSRSGDKEVPRTALLWRRCKSEYPDMETFYTEYIEGGYYDRSCRITYGYDKDGKRVDIYKEYGGYQ